MTKPTTTGKRRAASRTTSRKVAGKAAKVLADEKSTADERSVAASALAQAGDAAALERDTVVVAGLREQLRVESERVVDMGQQLRDKQAVIETLEAANGTLQAEVERLNAKLAAIANVADIALLQDEVNRLKEQIRWRDEQGSTRRP